MQWHLSRRQANNQAISKVYVYENSMSYPLISLVNTLILSSLTSALGDSPGDSPIDQTALPSAQHNARLKQPYTKPPNRQTANTATDSKHQQASKHY
jgi:hypothetical protein